MERTYGSLVRHELGSSFSALDGVPFKIGRAFRRPEQVSFPQLSSSKVSEVLSQEYTFETEEAVLAWAKARNEAVKKAAEEQARQQRERQTNETEQGEAAKDAAEKTNGLSSNADAEEISVYDVPRYSVQQPKQNNETKPPLPPKVSGLSTKTIPEPGTVLTPIPIKPSVALSNDKETSSTAASSCKVDSQFDLAMFEAEADPFDNLELQTLNDMEELKVLLNSNSVNTHSDLSVVQGGGAEASGSCAMAVEGFVDEAESATNQSELNTQNGVGAYTEVSALKKEDNQGGASSSSETSLQACDDGEYVEITPKYKNQTDISQCAMDNAPGGKFTSFDGITSHKSNSAVCGPFPASSISSQIYKPVLPPIPKSAHLSKTSTPQPASGHEPVTAQHGNSSCDTASNQLWNSPSFSPREGGKVPPLRQPNGQEFASSSPPSGTQSIKPSRPAPPPPVATKPVLRNKTPVQSSGAMSTSTGPSLAMFLGNSGQPEENSTRSPYSRHSNSTSDLSAGSTDHSAESPRRNSAAVSPQPWNRHVPLPPPPSNTYKPNALPTAQSVGLSDPYSSLSRDEKAFTDVLTNMGFLRPRVARAVQKFGTQEREVLDHLFAADKLGEQNYAPVMIESALFTFKNDLEKAGKFLQLHAQFEELGFHRDKIHDALVSTDLEHDKALDILTA